MAVEWATFGQLSGPQSVSRPGLACLCSVPNRISQTPGIFRPPAGCCQIQAPPHCYFPNALNLCVLFEISYFKGNFLNWKCITCCRWEESLNINVENTEQWYWILAKACLPARPWAWGVPCPLFVKDRLAPNWDFLLNFIRKAEK